LNALRAARAIADAFTRVFAAAAMLPRAASASASAPPPEQRRFSP